MVGTRGPGYPTALLRKWSMVVRTASCLRRGRFTAYRREILVFVSIFSKKNDFDAPLLKLPADGPLELATNANRKSKKLSSASKKLLDKAALPEAR
jgi:hypothetical protein